MLITTVSLNEHRYHCNKHFANDDVSSREYIWRVLLSYDCDRT